MCLSCYNTDGQYWICTRVTTQTFWYVRYIVQIHQADNTIIRQLNYLLLKNNLLKLHTYHCSIRRQCKKEVNIFCHYVMHVTYNIDIRHYTQIYSKIKINFTIKNTSTLNPTFILNKQALSQTIKMGKDINDTDFYLC